MMGVRACFRCSCFIIWFSNSSTGDAVVLFSPETRDEEVAGVADEVWACSLLFVAVAVACVTVVSEKEGDVFCCKYSHTAANKAGL
jgi:hypothetical protein